MQIFSYAMPYKNKESGIYRGKFIQFLRGGEEYLVFAPFELCAYHMEILREFLERENIPYHQPNQAEISVDPGEVEMRGGGRFHLDNPAGSLELSDNSQVYGRFESAGLAEKITAVQYFMPHVRIIVR